MRDFKFRAWDKEKKILVSTDLTPEEYENLGYCGDEYYPVFLIETILPNEDTFILMQYTGLKDKNGVEIYEGDILAVNDDELLISEVIFYDGAFMYKDYTCEQPLAIICDNTRYECEVIGNIYENKELLDER